MKAADRQALRRISNNKMGGWPGKGRGFAVDANPFQRQLEVYRESLCPVLDVIRIGIQLKLKFLNVCS